MLNTYAPYFENSLPQLQNVVRDGRLSPIGSRAFDLRAILLQSPVEALACARKLKRFLQGRDRFSFPPAEELDLGKRGESIGTSPLGVRNRALGVFKRSLRLRPQRVVDECQSQGQEETRGVIDPPVEIPFVVSDESRKCPGDRLGFPAPPNERPQFFQEVSVSRGHLRDLAVALDSFSLFSVPCEHPRVPIVHYPVLRLDADRFLDLGKRLLLLAFSVEEASQIRVRPRKLRVTLWRKSVAGGYTGKATKALRICPGCTTG